MPPAKHPFLFALFIALLSLTGFAVLITALVFWSDEDLSFDNAARVGVVHLRGVILDSRPAVEQLKKFRKDARIRAIVLRIESPGGSVAASQEINREVGKTVPVKKVVVSMGNVAASGGYYVAAAADRIVANPGTLTGSIGVIMQFSNVQELLQKIGVSLEVVKTGPFKDVGSPVRKMKPEERQLLEGVIQNVHRQFVAAIVKARRLPRADVEKMADGRIFTGEQAKELGLVDELGSFEDAVESVKRLARLPGEVKLVQIEKKKFSWWDLLLNKVLGDFREGLAAAGTGPDLLWVPPVLYKN
jgi:protease-4